VIIEDPFLWSRIIIAPRRVVERSGVRQQPSLSAVADCGRPRMSMQRSRSRPYPRGQNATANSPSTRKNTRLSESWAIRGESKLRRVGRLVGLRLAIFSRAASWHTDWGCRRKAHQRVSMPDILP